MRSSRGAVSAGVLAAALALSACSGGSGAKPTTSATTPPPATSVAITTTQPPTAPATTRKPTPPVPVDQIPPGHPASWVPAGVPTTAKYKEPGDVVPKFTQDMFKNTYNGALSVMAYYFDAVNWDAATGFTPSVYPAVCPNACAQDIKNSTSQRSLGRHLTGGRYKVSSPEINLLPGTKSPTWAGQFRVTVAAAKFYNSRGHLLQSSKATSFGLELDVRWDGRRWTVGGIYFVQ